MNLPAFIQKTPALYAIFLPLVSVVLVLLFVTAASAADPSIALYYAADPPVDELAAFDMVVVDPDSGLTPARYGQLHSELLAYVSVGEAHPARGYTAAIDASWVIGRNDAWNSLVLDVSSPDWRNFFIDKVLAPLWQSGFRGFFLDTLDSHMLVLKDEESRRRCEEGLVLTIREIRKRFPGVKLIANRGFELVDRVGNELYAMAAESLFQSYDAASDSYREVGEADRRWLGQKLQSIRSSGLPVIVIDYVAEGRRELARQTATKIRELGYIPWVADKRLSTLGVGSREVVPRRILGLYDGSEGDVAYTRMHRFAVMPLNYLGYRVEMHDLRKPLPDGVGAGMYAGVVVWPLQGASSNEGKLSVWLKKCIDKGVPILFMEDFGFPKAGIPDFLGIDLVNDSGVRGEPLKILERSPLFGFETPPQPQMDTFIPLRVRSGNPILTVGRKSSVSDMAAITSWGGYVLHPYVVRGAEGDSFAWVVNPFDLFRQALRLPDFPVPDTTTENGVRLMMAHVDGDGFDSRAEWRGGKVAAEELRIRILERYRIPTTVSVITGLLEAGGIYPEQTARELADQARRIFALPWVEAASHTYSHPFIWPETDRHGAGREGMAWKHNLDIPGYLLDVRREVEGSVGFVNSLLPVGKKAKMLLWTGNCIPDGNAVAYAYAAGVGNMNGGDTLISESELSLTEVGPLGLFRNGLFQVFAPNQNENAYTNNWRGPFHGYSRVLETFRLTDSPRRLKPVDIYYHFYSSTKKASIAALEKVYDWALAQRLFPLFASEYAEKVLDFNRTVVARELSGGWMVRNAGLLRQFRLPAVLGFPDMGKSRNIAGYADHGDSRYLHAGPGGDLKLVLSNERGTKPYLSSLSGFLKGFERREDGLVFAVSGYTPVRVQLANVAGCSLTGADRHLSERTGDSVVVNLPEGSHELGLSCR